MEAWRGRISTNAYKEVPSIEDIQLCAPDPRSSVKIPPSASLKFLSYVDIARIPLHFIAGSALEVCTNNAETEAWFEANLLTGFSLPSSPSDEGSSDATSNALFNGYQESDIAILLGIEGPEAGVAFPDGPQLTELLIYASATPCPAAPTAGEGILSGIPTPPRSSSPDSDAQAEPHPSTLQNSRQLRWEAKIHALPLSSHLSYHAPLAQNPFPPALSSAEGARHIEGHFLPPRSPTNPRKRQKLEALFDEAKVQSKRARKNGGVNVAKVMAGLDLRASSASATSTSTSTSTGGERSTGPTQKEGMQQQPQTQLRNPPKPSTRPSSSSALHDTTTMLGTSHSRNASTSSAAGPLNRTKRAALHRAASASDILPLSHRTDPLGPESPAPEQPTEQPVTDTFQARNKAALSRIIMAGMRMHGLAQRRGKTTPIPIPIPIPLPSPGPGTPGTPILGPNTEPSSRPPTASGSPALGTEGNGIDDGRNRDRQGDSKEKQGEGEGEDEYKLIYHRTLQAASFALRREMGTKIVGQERVREVVDALLGMFCGDGFVGGGGEVGMGGERGGEERRGEERKLWGGGGMGVATGTRGEETVRGLARGSKDS